VRRFGLPTTERAAKERAAAREQRQSLPDYMKDAIATELLAAVTAKLREPADLLLSRR
jgi:hypothetical protein